MSLDRIYCEVSPIFLSKTAFWQPFGILLAYFIRPEAVLLQRILKHATMNIYGILTAAGLFPAYQKAKKRLDSAKEALYRFDDTIRSMQDREIDPQITTDQNEPLSGVLVSVVLRLGNLVGQFFSADGYVTLTSIDKDIIVTHISASFTINNELVTTYIPIGTSFGFKLSAGETIQVPLSGNTGLIMIANPDGRDKLREQIVAASNTIDPRINNKLITSVPKNIEVDGICTANVEFYYTSINGSEQPLRAAYQDIPCVIRYMGEAFIPNEKNKYDPLAGSTDDWERKKNYDEELSELRRRYNSREITRKQFYLFWEELRKKYGYYSEE